MANTLHFKISSISRAKERPDNLVAACAYRAGRKLYDMKQEKTHDYSKRKGMVCSELIVPDHAPDWMKGDDWERLANEIESMEDKTTRRSMALLAEDFVAAAPRELSHDQSWALAVNFARIINQKHGLAVALAFHDEPARDGGRNPHFHMLVPFRQVTEEGFSKTKYRGFDRFGKVMMEMRRDYYACVNEALKQAGFNLRYSPEKQQGEPQRREGQAATALNRKGVETRVSKHNAALRHNNLMAVFPAPSEEPLLSSPLGLDDRGMAWQVLSLISSASHEVEERDMGGRWGR